MFVFRKTTQFIDIYAFVSPGCKLELNQQKKDLFPQQ